MNYILLLIALISGFVLGVIASFMLRLIQSKSGRELADELFRDSEVQRKAQVDEIVENVKASFGSLSLDALSKSTEEFLKLAKARTTDEQRTQAGTDGEDSTYFLAKTFERKTKFWEEREVNQLTAWQCFYNDQDIICQTQTEDAHTYEYWVFAYDQKGDPSQDGLSPAVTGYLGPDSATWGKPQVPVIKVFATQVHELNKWGCDVYLRWFCPGGAEYYLIRTKNSILPLYKLPVRIEHDYYGAQYYEDGSEIPAGDRDPEYQYGVVRGDPTGSGIGQL